MMELTKGEAKRIWEMANAFQIQMYERFYPHIKSLERIHGDNKEFVSKWIEECVKEDVQLHTIKAKMSRVIEYD